MKLPERILENARQVDRDYASANQILRVAVKDAMPWAMPLAMRGVIPSVDKIERLATYCMAILMATYPDEFMKPVEGFTLPERKNG